MVDLRVYASAGDFTVSTYLSLNAAVSQPVAGGGGTNVFLTNSDVYGATVFAHRNDAGTWDGRAFLGSTVIGSQGDIGFAPDALLTGKVGNISVDYYLTRSAAFHLTPVQLEQRLLSGDDRLIGNIHSDTLSGGGGNDFIDAGASGSDTLLGGDGNDVILMGRNPDRHVVGQTSIDGGAGDDVIAVTTDINGFVTGGKGNDLIFLPDNGASYRSLEIFGSDPYGRGDSSDGADTFYVSGRYVGRIAYFDVSDDRIQLDDRKFSALSGGVTAQNVVIGKNPIPLDGDDFILVQFSGRSPSAVFYDPNGNGPQKRVPVITVYGEKSLTADDFITGHLDRPGAAPSEGAARVSAEADQPTCPHHLLWPLDHLPLA